MLQRDVVDQLHDDHGLAHAGTAEQADLAPLGIRCQQIDNLDSGEQLLRRGVHLRERRRRPVDRIVFLRVDRAQLVNRLADDVDDAAQRLLADRHFDRSAGVLDLLPAREAVRAVHGDGAHHVLAQMLRHLKHQAVLEALHLQRVQNGRQGAFELHVHHGADDLRHLAHDGRVRLLREAPAMDSAGRHARRRGRRRARQGSQAGRDPCKASHRASFCEPPGCELLSN
mmetsp:Transcript_93254/g.182801  ORF Transcript_93254/g.182801 Transcript_93254/m.182801 type:complete len:227 (+) Transcript_93254:1135-1815(+)